MENACEELKQNGWALARSNDCGGVAGVIEQVLD
jgi:hydroxymethylpyrimidine pyrophosphatase-like HAD family hydrolase